MEPGKREPECSQDEEIKEVPVGGYRPTMRLLSTLRRERIWTEHFLPFFMPSLPPQHFKLSTWNSMCLYVYNDVNGI